MILTVYFILTKIILREMPGELGNFIKMKIITSKNINYNHNQTSKLTNQATGALGFLIS